MNRRVYHVYIFTRRAPDVVGVATHFNVKTSRTSQLLRQRTYQRSSIGDELCWENLGIGSPWSWAMTLCPRCAHSRGFPLGRAVW